MFLNIVNGKKFNSVVSLWIYFGLVCFFFGFYGISTFVSYLTMSTQFNCQKYFYFKLFKHLYREIQFIVSTVSMSKTVQFQIIQFSKSMQFECKYSLIVKNISISSYSVSSSSSNSVISVYYKYKFCLHWVTCQNSSMLKNSF